jgi:hypothetical protein
MGNRTEKVPEYTEVVYFGGYEDEDGNDTLKSDSALSETWSPLLDVPKDSGQSGNGLDNESSYARAFRHAKYNASTGKNTSPLLLSILIYFMSTRSNTSPLYLQYIIKFTLFSQIAVIWLCLSKVRTRGLTKH